MFTNDTDLFMTRVTNPTDKSFCHRGLPGYPVVPAKGYVDVKGVYTKLFRDEWYAKALAAGMQFEMFSTIKTTLVGNLAGLPTPAAEDIKPAAARPADPDTLPRAEEPQVVKPLVDEAADVKVREPFKEAAAEAVKRDENLPSGVVRFDDLQKAEEKRTVSDADMFQRSRLPPVTEKVAEPPREEGLPPVQPLAPQEGGRSEQKGGKGSKGEKKRGWFGAV